MVRSIDLTLQEFLQILEEFEKKCYKGLYDKVPYQMWRDLKRVEETSEVIIDWNSDYIEIFKDHLVHHLVYGDKSLGDFLAEHHLRVWDDWADPYGYWEDEYGGYHSDAEVRDTMKAVISGTSNTVIKADYGSSEPLLFTKDAPLMALGKDSADAVFVGLDTKADLEQVNDLEYRISALETKINTTNENEKEISTMKGFNFDFGPVNPTAIRMSMYGLAIKNKAGTFVSYDAKNDEIIDVDILNFDGAKYIWKMPVAIKDIVVGDTIVHQNVPMFVVGISDDKKALFAVDPVVGERKEIMLTRSPFGFHFATKVINLLGGMFNAEANADNPFGNMWMLMALGEGKSDLDFNALMPMMLMSQGSAMDPTMMMVMLAMGQEGNKGNDMMPLMMFLMANANKNASAHVCHCGGNCDHNG